MLLMLFSIYFHILVNSKKSIELITSTVIYASKKQLHDGYLTTYPAPQLKASEPVADGGSIAIPGGA